MQDWKQAEKIFEGAFARYGKSAFVIRLTDTAMAKAVGGTKSFVAAQPSDYIVVVEGATFFAEVKHSADPISFSFGGIQKGQMNASRRVTPAGGMYLFFVYSSVHTQWFLIPAALIHNTMQEKKSLKWSELQDRKWTPADGF